MTTFFYRIYQIIFKDAQETFLWRAIVLLNLGPPNLFNKRKHAFKKVDICKISNF